MERKKALSIVTASKKVKKLQFSNATLKKKVKNILHESKCKGYKRGVWKDHVDQGWHSYKAEP